MPIRILFTAALILAALLTGMSHAGQSAAPCVEEPQLVLLLGIAAIAGACGGVVIASLLRANGRDECRDE